MTDTSVRYLVDYQKELRVLGRASFVRRNSSPVLVLRTVGGDGSVEADYHTNQIDAEELQRLLHAAKTLEAPVQVADVDRVFVVEKRPGGPFQERIGVGRTRNTDVWLPYPTVSKYHAYFARNDDGSYTLTDAGSANGTSIDGKKLPPKTPVAVRDGAEVCFGPHHFLFLGAERFCDFLENAEW
jgi:hypothetical protein